jgi:hypothetical protein
MRQYPEGITSTFEFLIATRVDIQVLYNVIPHKSSDTLKSTCEILTESC